MLSNRDIQHLEKAGYHRQVFMHYDKQGHARLRNRQGFCVFYDTAKHRCGVYRSRPEGCRIYPVIYSEMEGIVLDSLCPETGTISETERRRNGQKVVKLLQRIDHEAVGRRARLT